MHKNTVDQFNGLIMTIKYVDLHIHVKWIKVIGMPRGKSREDLHRTRAYINW